MSAQMYCVLEAKKFCMHVPFSNNRRAPPRKQKLLASTQKSSKEVRLPAVGSMPVYFQRQGNYHFFKFPQAAVAKPSWL